MGSDTVIKITNLYKAFGQKQVLSGINLDIKKGEIFYIIGKSGEGKSVLLKNIIGLLQPDQGTIYINHLNILNAPQEAIFKLKHKYGVLFQMSALFDSLSVYENIAFTLKRFTQKKESEIQHIVQEKLALVGLRNIEHKKPSELSGGIQKRIGLARAIVLDPEIVFYDEPTTSVDPISAAAIDDLILSLNAKLNVTSVIISHDMNSVFRVAHRVAFLYQNNIELIGTPNDFKNSTNPVVQQFIQGSSQGPIPIL